MSRPISLSSLPPILLGAALVALAAQASLDVPLSPVPVTLQTLAVVLVGAWLGPLRGLLALALYLAAGALGAPVFASGGSGVERLVGPSAGFLWSFPVAAWAVGRTLQGSRGPWSRLGVLLAVHAGILAAGSVGLLVAGRSPGSVVEMVTRLAPGALFKSLAALLLLQLAGFRGAQS